MAFTIRELSKEAENNLERLQKNNPSFFKTKTKAIDYVLSNHYSNKKHICDLENENVTLKEQYKVLKKKMEDIKFAISILKRI